MQSKLKELIKKHSRVLIVVALSLVLGAGSVLWILQNAGVIGGRFTRYDMDLSLNSDDMTMSASQTTTFFNDTGVALDEIRFNLYINAFREGAKILPYFENAREAAFPNGKSYGGIDIESVASRNADKEFEIGGVDQNILIVKLNRPLRRGGRIRLDKEFTVTIPESILRFGHYDGIINLTNFFPIICVFRDGEFVEAPYLPMGDPFFSEAADFYVTLRVQNPYVIAHSGDKVGSREIQEVQGGGQAHEFSFRGRRIRDFALVLSEGFSVLTTNVGRVTVQYFLTTDDERGESRLLLAASALEYFSGLFGRYPYRTFNVVETNLTAGGMEYPNLILINRELSHADKETVIVHEAAHQWWYGIVGNDNINDAWQDEGLTELSTELFFLASGRKLKATMLYAGNYAAAKRFEQMAESLGYTDLAMNKPLDGFMSEYEYVVSVYARGHLMFRAVRRQMGEQNFKRALRRYVRSFRFRIATPEDLISTLERYTNENIRLTFEQWKNFTARF